MFLHDLLPHIIFRNLILVALISIVGSTQVSGLEWLTSPY